MSQNLRGQRGTGWRQYQWCSRLRRSRTGFGPPLLLGLLSICRNRTHSAAEHLEVRRLFPSNSWPLASTYFRVMMLDVFVLGFLSLLSFRSDHRLSAMMTSRVTPQPSLSRGTGQVTRVWMLSYECAGLAQAGGLGEAVAGLARTLAEDSKLEVTVFLPSHGRHLEDDLRTAYSLREETTFIANGFRTGTNHVHYHYLAGVEEGFRDSVHFVLVKGLDPQTRRWLDDRTLYDRDVMFEKMSLFARTVRAYSDYLLATGSLSN